jgi:hypothetical protein
VWGKWRAVVTTYCVAYDALPPGPRTGGWHDDYGKPLIVPKDGTDRSVPEIEVIKAFRASGWGARWPDTFGSAPAWMSPWKRAEVPKAVVKFLADIRALSPKARAWDAIAWRGDEVMMVESKGLKGRTRERLTEAEQAFIWGASMAGLTPDHFAVVLGNIRQPEA